MKIAITGSTGMVGQCLVQSLQEQGNEIYRIVRSRNTPYKESTISWDPEKQFIDFGQLDGIDVVIHLAGENISKRWSKKQKDKIENSRVMGTHFLSTSLARLKNPPKCLLSASAIGYYGNHPSSTLLEETSETGTGFLPEVVSKWESATKLAEEKGIRTIHMRLGVVLDKNQGALKKMLLPFRLGLGGKIATGRQVLSWIALDELPSIVSFLIENEQISGAVNIVSPEPVTNYRFTKTLGKVLGRPTVLPIPAFILRLIFGKMANELLIEGSRVSPKKLKENGYNFQYKDLEQALEHIFNPQVNQIHYGTQTNH